MTEYYRIQAAADRSGVPATRVRHYIRIGLISPSRTTANGPELGDDDLARLRKIRRLTADLGLNLAGVHVALRLLDEVAALRAELDRRA